MYLTMKEIISQSIIDFLADCLLSKSIFLFHSPISYYFFDHLGKLAMDQVEELKWGGEDKLNPIFSSFHKGILQIFDLISCKPLHPNFWKPHLTTKADKKWVDRVDYKMCYNLIY